MAITKPRKMDGGCKLVYPKRGNPPPIPEGYMRDDQDPFVMIKIWLPCSLRTAKPTCLPCGKIRYHAHCKELDKKIDQNICQKCQIRVE